MNWTNILIFGLFVTLVVYQAWKQNWPVNKQLEVGIFIIGAVPGLFLNNILTPNMAVISAVVMPIGLLVMWFWKPN
jgi:uncharacterized membrane protein